MDVTSILIWVVLGAIAGFIANYIKPNGFGTIGTIVSGVIGSFLGGYLGQTFLGVGSDGDAGINVTTIITAVVGALIFSFILGFVKSKT